jgi:1-acyl-sn-glycerol-3-phosphate acyltransferase
VYRVTRWVAHTALRLFYQRIASIDVAHLPSRGPVVLAANHPNYIIDAAAVAAQTPRQIHFVAKGQLLDRYPIASRLMRAIGVIPVFRPQDGEERMGENVASFSRCADLLDTGGVICVFAEGESHAEPRVRELRTGTARIVLEAEARRGYDLNVAVVPVGLYFPEEDRYFSDGVVVFGEPIDTTPYREQHADDPRGAVDALTAAIHDRMQRLTLHVPDWHWATFVEQTVELRTFRSGVTHSAAARLRASQAVAEAIQRFAATDPTSADRLRRDTDYLWLRIEASHRHAPPSTATPDRRRGLIHRVRDAVALPVATFGFLFNAPPYLIPRLWSQAFVQRREKRAFVKFVVGAPTVAAWYLATTHRVGQRSVVAGLSLWVVGPLSGLLALRMRAHRHRWLEAWRPTRRESDALRREELDVERKLLLARLDPWFSVADGRSQDDGSVTHRQASRSLN